MRGVTIGHCQEIDMKRILNWLKAAAAKYNSTSLILRIFIGLVIGVILAIVLPGWTWLGEDRKSVV